MAAGVVSELAVLFRADTSALEKGMAKARSETASMGDAADTAGGKVGGLGRIAGNAGAAIAGGIALGTVALGAFAMKAVTAASDIAESQNKVNVVFGDSAAAIDELAATATSKLGMTKAEVLSAAGGIGNLLTAMGSSKEAAAGMSVDMVKLATDLGSFNNASSTDVLAAMTAAMAGETEGMKRFGVAINEVTLKQAAMKAGLGDNVQALSASEKQMLSLKIMTEQTASAHGDFANTSDGMANSIKIIKATLGDMAGEIGGKLLPIIQPLISAFAKGLPGAIDTAVAMFAPFEGILASLGQLFKGDLAGAVDEFGSALGLSADAISPFYDAAEAISTGWADAGGSLDSVTGVIDGLVGAFVELLASMGVNDEKLGVIIKTIRDARDGFALFREKVVEVFQQVREAIGRVADWFNANVKPIIVGVLDTVVSKLATFKQQFDDKFGGIRGAVASVIEWFQQNVAPTLAAVFDRVMAVVGPVVAFLAAHMDEIKAIVGGAIDFAVGVFRVGFNLLKGIVETVMAVIRGDWSGAWDAIKATAANVVPGIKQALGGLWEYLKGLGTIALDAVIGVGTAIVDGIKAGILGAWDTFTGWVDRQIAKIPLALRKALGIASPSKVTMEIGENIVEGLRVGMQGMSDLATMINETLGRIIGDADRENFKAIAELTGSLLDIFTNTTTAIKALLSFDVLTSAAQISAQFDALVGTFETALLRMKGLAQYAGRGDSPIEFLNMFDVQNIEIVSRGFEATISLIDGLLDIAAKLQTVKIPNAAAIEALFEPLSKLGDVAARFINSVGTPEGEDATAYFNQGATTAAALASWAKSIADIVGIKFGAVAADFEAQMSAAATASVSAWQAVKSMAVEWGDKGVTERDKLLTGVKAYAEVVGAAVSILKGAGELDLSKAVIATRDLMDKAAKAAGDAVAATAASADWWVRNAEDAAKIVVGVKAYGEAVGAAVGMLATAGGLALDKAVFATDEQLRKAADVGAKAYAELLRVIGKFADMGEEMPAFVANVKGYADATSAAAGMLGAAGALDFSKAVFATNEQLADAADVAARALGELRRVIGDIATMGHEASGPLVQSIKDFAEGAGAALDLLNKGAGGIAALTDIKSLGGVQPALIRAILGNLKLAFDEVVKFLRRMPAVKEEDAAKIKGLGDMAGVFDPLAKAAAGVNALGAIKSLAGIQPGLIRAILGSVNLAVREVVKGAGTFKADDITKVKAWGEASAATLGALTTAADGLTKLGGKITIPEDLSARVAMLVSAMRTVVQGMAAALSGDGAISVDVAKAGADVAEAVGRIGEAFAPIFDAINAALASPFGRIKAKGQRGDTFRQNIADRIKASLVAAVTALSEALASMPAIEVPDTLLTGVERLATVYDRILDILGKLDGIKIDAKALAALAAVPGILAGGLTGMNVQGSGGTLTMSGGASGGGITINNTVTPTFMPMPTTINNTITAPITVGPRVVQAIAVEVVNQFDTEIKLKPSGP